jgi:hypothetical protein
MMDVARLHRAHEQFLDVVAEGGFGAPPPGEWDAERLLAHVAATDMAAASLALATASGQRPAYDNRSSLDEWNLRRLVASAGGLTGLAGLLRRHGELLCAAAGALTEQDLAVRVPVLIISGAEVVVDEPRPIEWLIAGIGDTHLPMHASQLASLRA